MKKSKKQKPEEEKPEPQKKMAPEKEAEEAAVESPAEQVDEALESRFLRLQADFDNFRKRTQKERGEWFRQANEGLMEELLPVLDHFEMGLTNAQQHHADDAVMNGFTLVYEQLLAALKKFGLEPIDAEGEEFNPHLHEAITQLPSNEHAADMVMAQTRRGFKLGDKLLRATQVVVSGGASEETETPADEEEK
ncbi:MAG: nucleotide exchange factor GrpE [Verrucomicrobia bacterium]|nr:nucleotide exchange factor GrpE [Verrucomicrobiota bacterium]